MATDLNKFFKNKMSNICENNQYYYTPCQSPSSYMNVNPDYLPFGKFANFTCVYLHSYCGLESPYF